MKKQNKKTKEKQAAKKQPENKTWYYGGVAIALLIFAVYSQTFKYDFVNWDDNVNIYENKNVVNFDVKGIFSEHVIGNYNPLSNFTFALEYKLVKDNAKWYHINNVLLHIICTLLIFVLMKRLGLNFFSSVIIVLLFGIHPMHVESVAWITERKDVLFGTFYLSSLLFYISYYKNKKNIYYLLSIVLFILSLLSKIQAVSLPLTLFLIDYWLNGKLTVKSQLNKIPFFLLSLVTGIIGIYFLGQEGSLNIENSHPIFQRLFIGSYSFVVYIIKSLVPYQLSAIYPYPPEINIVHYLSMIPAIAVVLAAFISVKKNKILTFGILFFTLNILFVLQVVGAGQGFIADRFSYIPYIGLFFIYALFIEKSIEKFSGQRILIYSMFGAFILFFLISTVNRIKVWENSETLWTDVKKKQPTAAIAYYNLGDYFRKKNENDKALNNYNIAIQLEPQNPMIYNNRGEIFFAQQQYDLALADYNKSLSVDPEFTNALANRGAVFGITKKYDEALKDLSKAISINPNDARALSNRGFVYYNQNENEKAIQDFNASIQLNPYDADILNMLGLCYARLKDYDKAISFYNRSIQIDPAKALYFMNRSFAYNAKEDKANALKDARHAQQLGLNVNRAYMEMLTKQ